MSAGQEFASVEDVLDAVMQSSTEFGNYEQRPTVNSRGFFGNVPLMPAINWSSPQAVELLIDAGADIDAVCEEGNTPLHHAILMGEFEIARILIRRGANQGVQNHEGKKPRDLCWEGEWIGLFGGANEG
jgi:ankyrin repeat protein